MKAVVLKDGGLVTESLANPTPKPNEVLIRVRASSINRTDLIMMRGHANSGHGNTLPVPGLEWAGEVVETGSEVPNHIKVGDRVIATGTAGFAEFAVADWGRVLPIPASGMSFEDAATLPLALMTMHDAIVTNGRLRKGETVLIQGASSGVGLVGLQIAKLMGAGLVIGTSTRAERRAELGKYGADLALDSRDGEWPHQILEQTGNKGVDLIIDHVSAGVMNQNMKAAAVLGRIVNVGRLGGFSGDFDFDLHALKRITYVGVTFRTRSIEEVRRIVQLMREDLWPHVEAGKIRLPVDSVYDLAQASEAMERMASDKHSGKIVLVSA
ncbi:zinc-binding dehydrogenase [Aminobacter sp. MSH1]|uniref:zinc-binding dehydrogenase n=1 Tax=Aminobacter sp. MSH1 TaxID=374606 RepID=UPI000D3700F2|nr:zinc-binding dehydrogenase [Aminobacter sp. MSH1]